MLRLISAADLVQRKGLALSFQWLSQFMIAASRRRTLSKLPRRIAWPVIIAHQRSTRLSHDALLGVKCRWTRGWAASHSFTVLPEPRCHATGASSGSICRCRAFPQRSGADPTRFTRSYRLFCSSLNRLPFIRPSPLRRTLLQIASVFPGARHRYSSSLD